MQVIVRGNGAELDRGRGSDVLEHPLNAVIWLARDLARGGLALAPGADTPSVFRFVSAVGFLGFGFYPRSGFMHIDLGPARSWRDP